MNNQIEKDLKKQFTIVNIDFYQDGSDVETFVFRAKDLSEEEAYKLFEQYEEEYNNEEFEDSFEDYLKYKKIPYYVLFTGLRK